MNEEIKTEDILIEKLFDYAQQTNDTTLIQLVIALKQQFNQFGKDEQGVVNDLQEDFQVNFDDNDGINDTHDFNQDTADQELEKSYNVSQQELDKQGGLNEQGEKISEVYNHEYNESQNPKNEILDKDTNQQIPQE